RYQELIERQFNGAINQDVLDMLNAKYLIGGDGEGALRIQNRRTAAGNAWIVNRVSFVESAEEEMRALDVFNPKDMAIVHEECKWIVFSTMNCSSENRHIDLLLDGRDHLV